VEWAAGGVCTVKEAQCKTTVTFRFKWRFPMTKNAYRRHPRGDG
jgi:hypothetical protein